ncbi:MAG: hypothetical protein ABL901_18415 [Hyphomicrobiaceae bacterium]
MQSVTNGHVSTLDPTDIPVISADAVQGIIDLIIERGQALVLFHGATPASRAEIERAFWQGHGGDRISGNATLIRFWHLVDAMSGRRVKSLILERGFAALAPLAACAASARLNIHWGFKPQHLVAALTAKATIAVDANPLRLAA